MFYTKDMQELFDKVQCSQLFEDQKIFADATIKTAIEKISTLYAAQKNQKNFNLSAFVQTHFNISQSNETKVYPNEPIEIRIEKLWKDLQYEATDTNSTLIPLPKPYIVPGGRFKEFFYWDSYFVLLGLAVSNKWIEIENIIENCAYLIQTIGHIPNGNRSYFLSRSQPPFFVKMLALLAEKKGDNVWIDYLDSLEKEYHYWMKGIDEIGENQAFKHIVKLKDGTILNRYFDEENEPRPESYIQDIELAQQSTNPLLYQHIRAACESGWDFSSRWFQDPKEHHTIETLYILPIDLNCLMYEIELKLSETYNLIGNETQTKHYAQKADARKKAIQQYFWDEKTQFFKDYNFNKQAHTHSYNLAGLFPLWMKIAHQQQAETVAQLIEKEFLKKGGLVTTTHLGNQQWDAPNAWAPLQWIAYEAFYINNQQALAEKIKNNWCYAVEKQYEKKQKLMEKYDAIDPENSAGGGEYPNQDGFGWTNGVFLAFKKTKL